RTSQDSKTTRGEASTELQSSCTASNVLFPSSSAPHRDLRSFPTRRSSDLLGLDSLIGTEEPGPSRNCHETVVRPEHLGAPAEECRLQDIVRIDEEERIPGHLLERPVPCDAHTAMLPAQDADPAVLRPS